MEIEKTDSTTVKTIAEPYLLASVNFYRTAITFNNKGGWKAIEDLFKKEYQADRDFDVRRIISYQDQTQIPSKIDVDAIIQGEYNSWSFELLKNT